MARKQSKIDWDVLERLVEIETVAERHTREIFGNRNSLPPDESEIAWNSNLTHDQKVEKLTALRNEKAVRRSVRKAARAASPVPPQSFEQRIADADAMRARGLGISLD